MSHGGSYAGGELVSSTKPQSIRTHAEKIAALAPIEVISVKSSKQPKKVIENEI